MKKRMKSIAKTLLSTSILATTMATNVFANTYINEDVVNVRTGNGTEYDVMFQLPYGTEVTPITYDVGNGWAIVDTPYGTGYVSSGLLATTPNIDYAYAIANQYSSVTNKLIVVDTSNPYTFVFHITEYGWELEQMFRCSVGRPETPTINGVFSIMNKRDYMDSGDTWEYFVSDFAFDENYSAWAFHSTLYYAGTDVLLDDTVGAYISNGCVRLHIDEARWIFDNCDYGTTVVVV